LSITITPLSDFLGAEIGGLDMHQPMDAADLAAVERAFLEHRVLRFRDGPMDVRQLAAFSRQFGELQPHVQRKFQHPEDPNVVEMRNFGDDGKFNLAAASRGAMENLRDGWHSDLSYDPVPAKATLLHALELPSHGGNTCFSDATRAYESLAEATKRRLAGLTAEFSYGNNTRNKMTNVAASSLDQQGRESTTVSHPVICAHPLTGRPAIYVNPLMTVRIAGIPEAESDALLEELFDALDRPDFRWEQEWAIGDTIMWENRGGVMHCGRLNYPRDQRRRFIRTTVRGQRIDMHRAA
jgi:taurine dioxygenase